MEELSKSNISSENENEERHKPSDDDTPEQDEFDLAYKMIFKDTLRLRTDQVWWWCKGKKFKSKDREKYF